MDIADTRKPPGAAATVAALYAEHALGLVRLAVVMTGDRAAAEDIVQDAFLGLYRRWDRLPDMTAPLAYLRVSVVNGCRTALRRRSRLRLWPGAAPTTAWTRSTLAGGWGSAARLAESAEARVLLSEQERTVAAALRKLPRRQREALVLRYYLDLSVERDRAGHGGQPRHREVRHPPRARRRRPDPEGGIMSREEDLIRSTTHAIASTVREVPALRLEEAPDELRYPARAPRRGRGRPRGWLSWGAPLTAAAVVVVLAIALVIVRDMPNGSKVPANPATSAGPGGVPRYYVALTLSQLEPGLHRGSGRLADREDAGDLHAARGKNLRERHGGRRRPDVRGLRRPRRPPASPPPTAGTKYASPPAARTRPG